MVDQIGGFPKEQILVVILAFDDEFNCFFPHLLGDFVQATRKQMTGIRTFRGVCFPVSDDFLQIEQEFAPVQILGFVVFAETWRRRKVLPS